MLAFYLYNQYIFIWYKFVTANNNLSDYVKKYFIKYIFSFVRNLNSFKSSTVVYTKIELSKKV